MEKKSIEIALNEAGVELAASINTIQSKYGLPSCLLEGLVSSALADIRKCMMAELTIACQRQQQEREKELVDQFTESSEKKPD